jgi:hypothetical protein
MNNRKDSIVDFFGRVIFILLFFFLISAFSGQASGYDSHAIRTELAADVHLSSIKAILVDGFKFSTLQNCLISISIPNNLGFFSQYLRINYDNYRIKQQFHSQLYSLLQFKTMDACRFYYLYFSGKSDGLPNLS